MRRRSTLRWTVVAAAMVALLVAPGGCTSGGDGTHDPPGGVGVTADPPAAPGPEATALASCLEVGAALAALRLAPVGGPATVDEVAAQLDELAPDAPPEVRALLERLARELASDGPSVLAEAGGAYAEAEAGVLDHLERTCGTP